MNKARRNTLSKVQTRLEELAALASEIRELIEAARDEEQEYRDNMPESFADGEKGEAADNAIAAMEEAMSVLETIEGEATEASEHLDTAAA
ncbi:hypothetical protein G8E10_24940 [Rhizobiaceae bacterium CRRU44]|uniref:Uncharacterized protein n=1 Tax=Ferranicluibacter rubi TaxID=2715133 RepID=A0AA44CD48_9HYPH|nr:hypothetical protein [Ferranicluibacter rubi]NHT78950.1 hypothetical protein [Ferranicluibacter rubi]